MSRPFDGLANFRDLGGIPVADGSVRPGLLFRSDSLSYASTEDAKRLAEEFRLATIVDLRDAAQVEEFGRGPLGETPIAYVWLPIGDVPAADGRSAFYAALLEKFGAEIADVIRALARPGFLPALVHCHIGCDRTGAVSAAILSLIGASDDDVAADYAASRRSNDAIKERSRERRRLLGLEQLPDSYYAAWDPRAEIMAGTLAIVAERWGSMRGWAAAMGLTDAEIAAVRDALVGS